METLAWYIIYLAALGLFVLRYGSFLSAVWLTGPLLLWPLIAGLSFFWSDNPGQTLRSTIQLTMTVLIAAYIGGRFSLNDICRALLWVLIACGLVSLVGILAKLGFAYDHNGVARGIFPHKNVLGGRMVLLLICSILLFAIGWHRFLTLATASVALALIALSQSGTAILMTFGLCTLVPVFLAWRAPAPLRLMSYLMALLVAALGVWTILAFDIDPMGMALDALGKERTFTGRSVLWDFAMGLIERRPFVGTGFDGFWDGRDGSTSSYVQYVLRQDLKNFHNSYLDITVQLGVLGLCVALLTGLWYGFRALAALHYGTGAIMTLPVLFLVFVAVYSLSEYALFRQHSLIQILLGATFVASARFLEEGKEFMQGSIPAVFARDDAKFPQSAG
ncbi:O-antigen ligase family protein [Pelagibius litoralis]|uniref:O-antigen ligase family protein n=1 Tax=Pelagibius litoralis TaxID=374515 RepID=A0A967CAF6_9PROT|nr:O-antigen ligase [Pelagibius litoralis]NIA67648.1 O-antigen ligase family protein [Pelagibius litoralis]